jgi:hypothetical protein
MTKKQRQIIVNNVVKMASEFFVERYHIPLRFAVRVLETKTNDFGIFIQVIIEGYGWSEAFQELLEKVAKYFPYDAGWRTWNKGKFDKTINEWKSMEESIIIRCALRIGVNYSYYQRRQINVKASTTTHSAGRN